MIGQQEQLHGYERKPQLILDIGGVLATNISPLFWQLIAHASQLPLSDLYGLYKHEISEHLWTGQVSEEAFWLWLEEHAPAVSVAQARAFLTSSLQPLPAIHKLKEWSQHMDVHILSNHLPAWVDPILNPFKPYLKSITISSEIGLRKPQRGIYEHVAAYLPADRTFLFVDDQEKNLQQAATLGWRTLLADQEGTWANKVFTLVSHSPSLTGSAY